MITAVYYLETLADPAFVADQIAKEQSAGHSRTWREVSTLSQEAGRACVIEVTPTELRGHELPVQIGRPSHVDFHGRSAARIVVRYNNWEPPDGLVSLLNVVLGEPQHLALVSALRLDDLQFPEMRNSPDLTGPLHGSDWFCDSMLPTARAIICAPIKPSAGLLPEEAARLAYEAAMGGATIVKDDELAFPTSRSSSSARSIAVARAVRRAEQESNDRKIYVANLIGTSIDLIGRAKSLVAAGADGLLVAPALQGYDIIANLRANDIHCPIVAHNCFSSTSTRLTSFGMSPSVWALLQRMAGADGVVIPSSFGSFGFDPAATQGMVEACSKTELGALQALAMHSGSVSVRNAESLIEINSGVVCALTSGTGIFDHPDGPRAGAAVLRSVVDQHWTTVNRNPSLRVWMRNALESSSEWL